MQRYLPSLFVAILLLAGARPAIGQIIVSEDPQTGERLLMSEQLRPAEHKMMVRAVGRVGNSRTEWILMFRSSEGNPEVHITAADSAINVQRVTTDEDVPGGMTTVYLSGDAFYEVAHAPSVQVTIGERALPLPAQVQEDMQEILSRSQG